MKNTFKLALLSFVLMMSCSKENELPTQTPESTKFYASIEASDTRTYADENGKLLWTADDRITVFKGNAYARQYRYTGETGLNSGEFNDLTDPSKVITGNALSANYAVYPYDGSTSITNEGVISYTIPATQNYAKNSFGLGANTMVAVTKNIDDNFLAFKNIGGYFEFSLYGDVTVRSIEFKGNNNEKLAGAVTITATNGGEPTVVFSNEATKTITLDCGASGIALGTNAANATKFWFVVPAITYSKGITITITSTDGRTMEKSTSNSITIKRSTVQPLDAIEVISQEAKTPPYNQIWYTSSDGKTIGPDLYNTNPFGVSILSNIYENGRGILTFDGDVTSIGENAFMLVSDLVSIILPNSITSIGKSAFSNCTSLTNIVIPNLVSAIGDYAFENCSTLVNITFPAKLKYIGSDAFENCSSLKDVTIPQTVISIEGGAFSGCKNLTHIEIPKGITVIDSYTFNGCTKLENVSIPNTIERIGVGAFKYCPKLKSLTIPSSVKTIEGLAFMYCELNSIYCKPIIPPSVVNTIFLDGNESIKIYVPNGSLDAYKSADGWDCYASKIEGYNFNN